LSRYEEQGEDAQIVATLQCLYAQNAAPLAEIRALCPDEAVRSQPVHALEIGENDRSRWPQLMAFIQEQQLFPVVHLRTSRRSLTHQPEREVTAASSAALSSAAASVSASQLPLPSFTVVLDEADFLQPQSAASVPTQSGYCLAEVERVLTDPSEAQMQEAEQQVTQFAALLQPPSSAPYLSVAAALPLGKVERFLALFRPWHYRLICTLVAAAKQKKQSTPQSDCFSCVVWCSQSTTAAA